MMRFLFKDGKFVMSVNNTYKPKENEVVILGSKYDYEKMKFSHIDDNGNIVFDEEAYHQDKKMQLLSTLSKRYNRVVSAIPRLIDPDIFQGLEEVYKTKYEAALEAKKSNNYSFFADEAKIFGVTAQDIANKVIQIGTLYKKAYNAKVLEIDAARVYIKKLIEYKCYEEALKGLRYFKNITPQSSFDKLMSICTGGLSVLEYCKNKL